MNPLHDCLSADFPDDGSKMVGCQAETVAIKGAPIILASFPFSDYFHFWGYWVENISAKTYIFGGIRIFKRKYLYMWYDPPNFVV